MKEVDARARLEHFHYQMVLAAVADRSIGERRIRLARLLDEFLQRLRRYGWADDQQHLRVDQCRDGCQILQRVERHLRVEMRADHDLGVGAQEKGVAVWRSLCGELRGEIAVGARAV